MAVVIGVRETISKLSRLKAATEPNVKVRVGYSAPYALFVHENREMVLEGWPRPSGIGVYWGPNGRAGFLLDVAKEMKRELADFLAAQLKRGIKLTTAMYWAGRRLEKESRRNVPVEYGELRDSSFTKVEQG